MTMTPKTSTTKSDLAPSHGDDVLIASTWQKLPIGSFFSRYEADGPLLPEGDSPADVFQPASMVPIEVLIRTSEREKRLEFNLDAREITSGQWGALFEIAGDGNPVGLLLRVAPQTFCGAHALLDVVHLLANTESVANDATIKDIHLSKTVRVFRIGSDDNLPHDIVMTTKSRWFRNRNNPKHLGFSKEEK
jgi:hypothetical protein